MNKMPMRARARARARTRRNSIVSWIYIPWREIDPTRPPPPFGGWFGIFPTGLTIPLWQTSTNSHDTKNIRGSSLVIGHQANGSREVILW